jgi:hypothetical protein
MENKSDIFSALLFKGRLEEQAEMMVMHGNRSQTQGSGNIITCFVYFLMCMLVNVPVYT